jgi:thymidine kinase
MAELVFHTGPMDSGKSTLALQMDHAQSAHDRAGTDTAQRSSRRRGHITSQVVAVLHLRQSWGKMAKMLEVLLAHSINQQEYVPCRIRQPQAGRSPAR